MLMNFEKIGTNYQDSCSAEADRGKIMRVIKAIETISSK
jgi:hypothetical protein